MKRNLYVGTEILPAQYNISGRQGLTASLCLHCPNVTRSQLAGGGAPTTDGSAPETSGFQPTALCGSWGCRNILHPHRAPNPAQQLCPGRGHRWVPPQLHNPKPCQRGPRLPKRVCFLLECLEEVEMLFPSLCCPHSSCEIPHTWQSKLGSQPAFPSAASHHSHTWGGGGGEGYGRGRALGDFQLSLPSSAVL